jgi:hypothetical protein
MIYQLGYRTDIDRNNVEKWVWLCAIHHYQIHHWKDWISQDLRYKCIDYINNLIK